MGNGNKVEIFIAICAMISSLVAVFIAWDQGRVMRAQQHGEALPILQVDGYFSNTNTVSKLGIRVSNNGVGPALIESVTLEIGGEPVDSLDAHLDALPGNFDLSWESMIGRAIAPGQTVSPLDLSYRRGDVSFEELATIANQASEWILQICYCSVFDRCWQTERLGMARANRVNQCIRSETDIFTQFGTRPPSMPSPPSQPVTLPPQNGAEQ